MNDSTTRPVFSDSEPLDEVVTRPFRPSSIVALLLGGISFAAIFSPRLLLLPVVAIAVGLFALRPVRRGGVKPTGRGVAGVGIALALFFGSWSFAYFETRRAELTATTVPFALNWLDMIGRGGKEAAFELTKHVGNRLMADVSPKEFYHRAGAREFVEFDAFQTGTVVSAISNAATKPKWKFVRTSGIHPYGNEEFVVLVFEDTTGTLAPIQVVLSRQFTYTDGEIDYAGPRQWYVVSTKFV